MSSKEDIQSENTEIPAGEEKKANSRGASVIKHSAV